MSERSNPGVTMSYREMGAGAEDPVILLHAFPLNGRMWEPQVAALAGERRVITPDYPGFGRAPRTPAQPDVRYYAEEVRSLLDRLELERVVLGGLSMGGYVAFECLRLFPERIAALVLADTRPDPDTEEMKESRRELARRVAEEGVGVLAQTQPRRLLCERTLEERPEVVERVKGMILESTPGGVVAALGAMRDRPDSTPLLESIRVPTLVIGGEEDAISTPETMGEMAKKIPHSRHVVLPRAGHLSNLENPEGFNAALGELLRSL
ncbi:alpha/beta hydrolase fold [Rubrobacter xylanophilus DSM 9941]|uniref:Alpha/beta hydrolase fold n=2 Tax=Rubrobacter xylanophilus TaxID=49319 RepID=Q1AZR4_RUBXD|nr:alpha/beta hydrolase fold [Rubrobacter xylanophilus DSM 9941]